MLIVFFVLVLFLSDFRYSSRAADCTLTSSLVNVWAHVNILIDLLNK